MPSDNEPIEAELLPNAGIHHHGVNSSQSWITDLSENRLILLSILFLVTGVLGLPLLWISSKFTNPQKIGLTVVVTLYTIALIALTIGIMMWSWSRISESMN